MSSMTASGLALKRPPHILLLMARLPRFRPSMTAPEQAARDPRQEAACHGRGRRHRRRRRRAGGGIRDRHDSSAMRETPPAPRRSSWRSASRRSRAGRWPRSRSPIAPLRLPDLAFRDAAGNAAASRRLARAHRAAQPVGHLVRALPQGDAGARRARGRSSAGRLSRWSRSISIPATPTSRVPGSRRSASADSAITPTPAPRFFRT